ncbi:recombinase RecA, partial [Pyxidicoccus sp. 3LFB2]
MSAAVGQRAGTGAAGSGSVVEQLRERIRQLQAAPRRYLAVLRTGMEAVDALLPAGGFPLGQAVELC